MVHVKCCNVEVILFKLRSYRKHFSSLYIWLLSLTNYRQFDMQQHMIGTFTIYTTGIWMYMDTFLFSVFLFRFNVHTFLRLRGASNVNGGVATSAGHAAKCRGGMRRSAVATCNTSKRINTEYIFKKCFSFDSYRVTRYLPGHNGPTISPNKWCKTSDLTLGLFCICK